tara:strand:+ start:102 stop:263 length:162 start_codon:yes stop_codon:yes gene_type:complete
MAKIISQKWADKDDPIFTGRVTISSHRKKPDEEQNYNDLLDALKNHLSSKEDS